MSKRLRIAVVSPFLDKRHGTERAVSEQVERLANRYGWEVHIYSQRVEDLAGLGARMGSDAGTLTWHRVPAIRGPHLIQFTWWFCANHVWRWWGRHVQGTACDIVYSPGINCMDAGAISVHIVFAQYYQRVKEDIQFRRNPRRAWWRLLHRHLYYRLIIFLEGRIYARHNVPLLAISNKVAHNLIRLYGENSHVRVSYYGLDLTQFNPGIRASLRPEARRVLDLEENMFCLLLVGNDWKNKGLKCLLDAMARVDVSNLRLMIVGKDDVTPFDRIIRASHLDGRVSFHEPTAHIEFYYAIADAYVAPSLEDAFALPPAEAMACGLPVIVSRKAGVSEWITHGTSGLILEDPKDAQELAQLIDALASDQALYRTLGENAVRVAQEHTWERNAEATKAFLEEAIRLKRARSAAG